MTKKILKLEEKLKETPLTAFYWKIFFFSFCKLTSVEEKKKNAKKIRFKRKASEKNTLEIEIIVEKVSILFS